MADVQVSETLDLISTNEAAEICGVYRTTIWDWINAGKLRVVARVAGKALLNRNDVQKFAEERAPKPQVEVA